MEPQLLIGTSGYQYKHWKGVFYPDDIPQTQWFDYYASQFNSVEINNTFYNLPDTDTFTTWRARAPNRFRYALKYSRYGSHIKRLKDPADHIGLFLEHAEQLKSFLGPILVQLPPNWKVMPERLDAFLAAAPRRQRWAVEIRDPAWFTETIFGILEKHNAALCLHDRLADHPVRHTADWAYLRYHGPHGDYTGSYPPRAIDRIAGKITDCQRKGMDVFCYFNNDQNGYAAKNARELARRVLPS